ncbi:hypothetical protein B0T25DRAFT_126384 [Lasiosphaeria hispida]|uniref:Uncharacterized protein n=1 Tax=Lasiosphaeria hispida TaxID=260671 RepID=A0AAJ0HRY2_9PEZI|nr:hypothetical protein B0T25DRAFT_126384 [Lasiosphaeria hispida]
MWVRKKRRNLETPGEHVSRYITAWGRWCLFCLFLTSMALAATPRAARSEPGGGDNLWRPIFSVVLRTVNILFWSNQCSFPASLAALGGEKGVCGSGICRVWQPVAANRVASPKTNRSLISCVAIGGLAGPSQPQQIPEVVPASTSVIRFAAALNH